MTIQESRSELAGDPFIRQPPDVTVISLHAPPNPDPDPSPDGFARDVTDDQTHTFGEACFYDVVFASADDDGGTGADDIAVIIVGNFPDTRSHGYFKSEIRKLRDHSAAGIQCLLDITGFMSQVFHEVRDASTPAAAQAVFEKSGSSAATDIFDLQLLAAWMNFADGRVALTDLVDTDRDGVADTTFADLIARAELVRLTPRPPAPRSSPRKTASTRSTTQGPDSPGFTALTSTSDCRAGGVRRDVPRDQSSPRVSSAARGRPRRRAGSRGTSVRDSRLRHPSRR